MSKLKEQAEVLEEGDTRRELGEFECYAADVINIHLVETAEEVDPGHGLNASSSNQSYSFHPDGAFMLFGEEGIIYGYKDLQVDIWMHASSFLTHIQVRHGECLPAVQDGRLKKKKGKKKETVGKLPENDSDGRDQRQPHPVKRILQEAFPGTVQSKGEFLRLLPSQGEAFRKMLQANAEVIHLGHHLDSLQANETEKAGSAVQSATSGTDENIVRLDLSREDVKRWHAQFSPLVPLLIQQASKVENDDPHWEIYLALQRNKLTLEAAEKVQAEDATGCTNSDKIMSRANGEDTMMNVSGDGKNVRVVGFCLVYRFFHFPDSSRLRLSQVLVLPPYQKSGHAFRMLSAVNEVAVKRSCYDVTVEDPSSELSLLRETMDVIRLLRFSFVLTSLSASISSLVSQKEAAVADSCGNSKEPATAGQHKRKERSRSKGELDDETNVNEAAATAAAAATADIVNAAKLMSFPKEIADKARKELKISSRQFRRCWESLLFLRITSGPPPLAAKEQYEEEKATAMDDELVEKQVKAWEQLVMTRIRAEEVGNNKEVKRAKEKVVIDLPVNGASGPEDADGEEGEDVSIRPFVMMKVPKRAKAEDGGDGKVTTHTSAVVLEEGQQGKQEAMKAALKELLQERVEEVVAIIARVQRIKGEGRQTAAV
eukprot:TRINITY_DN12759_c1_g1_i2.p1 TRINITY_DN12759_c1_g1~~TRINITY_DN12759_c1_g1_i2.p1  ORF type:complete len:673 (-),score=228.43 TRINITY_DN12759_c1_g1_i2:88-2058(-)